LALLPLASAVAAIDPLLTTVAERSGFTKTGRYDEVIAMCGQFQRSYPKFARCLEYGRTPEGRPMLALVVSRTGVLQPEAAHMRNLPIILIQGGIHAGEIDGKDAGFQVLREALDNHIAGDALNKQIVIFVPVFNVDGHERFGRWNRPNQRGPEEMGWRTTAQNFNLNRDYAKADSQEMQAMLRLVQTWDPLAVIDLHVTDGAKFQHDVSIQVEPAHAGDAALQKVGTTLRDNVIGDLTRAGSLPLPFYPSFVVEDDPASGFADEVSAPRFSTGYFLLRNRIGMLVETHSWKDYATRVNITRNAIVSVLTQVGAHGAEWRKTALSADVLATQLAGAQMPLAYAATDKVRRIAFRGYEYTRTQSPISGTLMTRYDESKPQVWDLPIRDEIQPSVIASAPRAGYLVPPAFAAQVGQKLALHGISFRTLWTSTPEMPVETYRATRTTFDSKPFESHQRLSLQGEWKNETREVRSGSLFVPISQAKSRLVMALLEPQAPDSLLAWGMFNNAFEIKEVMEDYVTEEVAEQQLSADPVLAAAFKKKLADEPAFAKDPAARLEYFARRHTSWDERFNLYPVLRTSVVPK
jgi:hypothetical protein